MSSVLKITTFNRFTVSYGDREWRSYRSDKVRALLLYLAMADGKPQRREHLATLLWPESGEKSARTNLRVSFLNLRKEYTRLSGQPGETLFVSDRTTIQMLPGAYTCDVIQIQQALKSPLEDEEAELSWLAHLAGEVSDDVLSGINNTDSTAFEEWLLLLRENTRHNVMELLERLISLYESRQDDVRVAKTARTLLTVDSWREPVWQQLFMALGRSNDFQTLETAWERCNVVLRSDLGIAPSEATVEAYRNAKKADRASAAVSQLGNLRPSSEAFFGRTEEHDQIVSMLKQPQVQLATILGAGGIGKSRLSREVGRSLQTNFVDGVWFITFAGSRNDDFLSIISNVLTTNEHGGGDSLEQLKNAIRNRNMLLIFDNFEDVLDEVPTVVELLEAAPELKILCTSREALEVSAEWVVPLSGLRVPDADDPDALSYGCIQLFARRAQQSDYRFKLDRRNLNSVIGICHFVSGSPLGVELAAAWMRNQNAHGLLKMMRQSPDVLQTKRRDVPERHRSMRTIFMHSWQNLEPNHREVLARLSLFSGAFSAEEAEIVAGASYFDLAVLSDKALLQVDEDSHRMHPLVRSYSFEHLPDNSLGYRQFSEHFLTWASQQSRVLMGLDGRSASRQFSQRYENMVYAWKIALESPNLAMLEEALGTFIHFWNIRGRAREGIELLTTTVKTVREHPNANPLTSLLYEGLARLLLNNDQYEKALLSAKEAMVNGNEISRPWAQLHIGDSYWQLGKWSESRAHFELAFETFEEQKNLIGVSRTLTSMGIAAMQQGELETAHANFIRALSLSRDVEDAWGQVHTLIRLCILTRRERRLEKCREWGEAALKLCTRTDDLGSRSTVLNVLAELAHDEGRYDDAVELLLASDKINEKLDLVINGMFTIWYLGRAYFMQGNLVEGEEKYNEALETAQSLGHDNWESQILIDIARLKLKLGDQPAAERMAERSLQLARSIGNEEVQAMAQQLWDDVSLASSIQS